MKEVRLRPGTLSDAPMVAALATYVFLDTYASEGLRDDLAREVFNGYSQPAFAARLGAEGMSFVLAVADDHVVGFAEVAEPRACPVASVTARRELVRLYVHPRFQGSGVGSALLAAAEADGPVWLTAWSRNANALAFYAARGYARLGTVPYAVEDRVYENYVLAREEK